MIDVGNPINWGHPLAQRGLIRHWLAAPGLGAGGVLRDVAPGKNHATSSGSSPGIFSASNGLMGASTKTTATQNWKHTRPPLTSVPGFTFAAHIQVTSVASGSDMWGKWDNTGTMQQFARWVSGINWFCRNGANSAEANITFGSSIAADGKFHLVCCVADGGNVIGYLDGVRVTSASLAGPYIPNDTVDWSIGATIRDSPLAGILWFSASYFNQALRAPDVRLFQSEASSGYPTLYNRTGRYRKYFGGTSVAAPGGSTQPPRTMHQFRMRGAA